MAADVKFRIGGSLDKSVDVCLSEFSKRMDKAARRMADVMSSAQKMIADSTRSANREILSDEEKLQREITRIEKGLTSSKEIELRRQLADKKRVQRELINSERDAARNAQRELERFAARTSYRATRFLFPRPEGMIGYGKRVGTDVMRGLGINFDIGSSIQRNVANQTLATRLSNQGWVEGEGKFEDRISAKAIRANSQGIANKYGFNENEVTAATQAYTNLTGDLKTAIPLMDKLALLSKSTGTELSDAANAAADMGVALKDTPDKADRLQKLLGIAAMQGKTGALELFQLAPQMPRIVSQTRQFAGSPDKAMAELLASTQLIRRFGGAGTPSQAATALVGAVAALHKGGGAPFLKQGIHVENDKGQLRSLQDIAIESIQASYGPGGKFNSKKFYSMWNAIRGGKLAQGLLGVYNEAGGGVAGQHAIREQYAKFTRPLSVEAQQKMAGEAMNTPEAKAQRFQNQVDKIVDVMATKLIPQLEQLAPTALKLVDAFTRVVSWAATNPGEAITAAIGLSIARAGIESGFRRSIEQALGVGTPFQTGAMQAGGKMMNFATTASNAITLIAAAVAAYELGKQGAESIAKRGAKEAGEAGDVVDPLSAAHGAALESGIATAREKLAKIKADRAKRGSLDTGLSDWVERIGGGRSQGQDVAAAENMIRLKEAELARFKTTGVAQKSSKLEAAEAQMLADAIGNKTLRVLVTNQKGGDTDSPAGVDPRGREPAPGHR